MTAMHSEGEFTTPRPDCPLPHLWSAPDNDSAECEVSDLVWALIRVTKPALVVETGAAFGYTAFAIGTALRANTFGTAVSLEIDANRVALARDRTSVVSDYVTVVQQSSLDYEPSQPIDFAWFDSLFELRRREFDRFYDAGWLRPGALVGFHDTGPHYPVRADVEALIAADRLRGFHLPTPRGVSFGIVTS